MTSNMRFLTAGVWVLAAGAIIMALYHGRDILAPFALAVFLWLIIEGMGRELDVRIKPLPSWGAHAIAVLATIGGVIGVTIIFASGLAEFARKSGDYEQRIDGIIAELYGRFSLNDTPIEPPRLSELLFNEKAVRFVQPLLDATQELASSFVLVLIYIAFLFMAASAWPAKLDQVFTTSDARSQAREVGNRVRQCMEQYLWVQTAISALITVLTYFTLLVLGLDNALFWAFLVFFLNYIPTLGSIVAAILPGFFALAQPDWPAYMPADPTINALIVFLAVSVWQFVIGNFVQPRLMGADTQPLGIGRLVITRCLGRHLGHTRHVSIGATHGSIDDIARPVARRALDRRITVLRWTSDASSRASGGDQIG